MHRAVHQSPFNKLKISGLGSRLFGESVGEALQLVPGTAGEVGDFHRHVPVLEGEPGERGDAAPFGEVVHVHVQRQAVAEAVDQAVVHDVVHPAVAAHFLGEGLEFGRQDGVRVLLEHLVGRRAAVHFLRAHRVGVHRLPFLELAEAEHRDRVLGGIAVRAHDLVHAAVRARGHHVVLHEDRLALLGTDEGGRLVAGREGRVRRAVQLLGQFGAVERLRVHRYEGLHPVAAVDVHHLAHRAEAVGGIQVAAVLLVLLEAPVVPVGLPEGIQVVLVGAFRVDGLADGAGLDHRQGAQLEEIVAAVLQHNAVLARALGRVDEGPDVLQGAGGGHFDGGVLAVFHRAEGDGHVVAPVRADVDEVEVLLLAERLVGVFRAGVFLGGGHAAPGEDGLAFGDAFGNDVAEGGDDSAGDIGQAFHGVPAAHAEADDADADGLQGVGPEADDILLPGRTRGDVGLQGGMGSGCLARCGEERTYGKQKKEVLFHHKNGVFER